jgi:hypothetical protein
MSYEEAASVPQAAILALHQIEVSRSQVVAPA